MLVEAFCIVIQRVYENYSATMPRNEIQAEASSNVTVWSTFSTCPLPEILAASSRFPRPIHEGRPAISHLAKVLAWLREQGTYDIDESLMELAFVNMQCNLIKETRDLDPNVSKRLRGIVT